MVVLKGITWDHPRGYQPLLASAKLYEKLHGIRVNWEARSLKDFGDASLLSLAREYDLIVIDHPHIGEAADANCLIPFNEFYSSSELDILEKHSAGSSFQSYNWRGKQWALPLDAACQVSSFRPDILENVPLPSNWKEVIQFAEILRKKEHWMAIPLCPTDALCCFLTLSAQLNDAPSETKTWIKKTTTLSVLHRLRNLRDVIHSHSLDWNPIAVYDAMSTDSSIAYCPLAFGYINYVKEGFRAHSLRFSEIPEVSGALLGGAGLAISTRVSALAEASDYAMWVCSSDFQSTTYLSSGGQPAHLNAWKADSLACENRSFLQPTFATLNKAYVRPRFAGWPSFQEELGILINRFLKLDLDPVHICDELESVFFDKFH